MIIALYIDNIILFRQDKKEIDTVKKKLKECCVDKLLEIHFI